MNAGKHMVRRPILAALMVAALAWPLCVPLVRAQSPDVTPAILGAAATGLGASAAEARAVEQFYAVRAALGWTTREGALTPEARAVLGRVRDASRHGLEADTYLTPAVTAALDGLPMRGDARVARDAATTLAALRYMRDLHLGRVDPRTLGLRLPVWDEPHDFARFLAAGVNAGRPLEAIDGLAPPYVVYGQLVEALATYRTLATRPLPPLSRPKTSLRPGDDDAVVPAVVARLEAFGDLDPAARPESAANRYDAVLAEGVARFQARHGLTADGVLGARTLAALAVTPAARARQIAIALERLRWLPDLGARRVVAVNIPMFQLWAWDAGQLAAKPVVAMPVIVGRAVRNETPVFVETMTSVIFRPYWNVPRSIVRNEVLPAIRRDPRYLSRQNMELVRGPGDDGAVVPADAAALAGLASGELRLRQRPGPTNALGLVKFQFPNPESVYMHGTPAQALFARDRRDFSHGCIRVADPPALAAWALAGVSGWSPARIAEAMAASTRAAVDVAAPIDVVLLYLTASVDPTDGRLHFADDIYGHDAALERALARER